MEITTRKKSEARVWLEEQEVCREYHRTEKITFGMSELAPGAVGALDPGHSEAHEIFYCVAGTVLVFVPEDDRYYPMEAGDAMLIPEAKGHKLFNIGQGAATIVWACAPHQ